MEGVNMGGGYDPDNSLALDNTLVVFGSNLVQPDPKLQPNTKHINPDDDDDIPEG